MEFSKIAIKNDYKQKEKIANILKDFNGRNIVPQNIPFGSIYYYVDEHSFIQIGLRKPLEAKGYRCVTIEEYEMMKNENNDTQAE